MTLSFVRFACTLLALTLLVPSGGAVGISSPIDLEIWIDPVEQTIRVEANGHPVPFPIETDSFFQGDVLLVPWTLEWYSGLPHANSQVQNPNLRIAGRTTFHLPPSWLAVTNGEHLETNRTDSTTIDVWHTKQPTERSFCAGPFEAHRYVIEDRPVNVFLLSDLPGQGEPQARALADAVKALEARFGPCPYPAPSLVEFPQDQEWWHAISTHGSTLAETSAFLFAGANLPVMAHEVGHAWWGNLVRAEGLGALVCTESLAQYAAALAVEAANDDRAAAEFMRWSSDALTVYECARGYFALVVQGLDKPLSELRGDAGLDLQLAYAKGPWVFRMLRRRVGDEVFFDALREVIEEHAETALTLDLLRQQFLEAAPAGAELETFFAQWLDRTGAPVLEMHWEEVSDSDDSGPGVSVMIEQVQGGEPFSLWLDVGVLSDAGVSTHRVEVSETVTKARLPVQGSVEMLVLDPRHALLIWDPEYGVRAVRSGQGK